MHGFVWSSHAYHPTNSIDIIFKRDGRVCQISWFKSYAWLTFCKTKQKLYCFHCILAFERDVHPEADKNLKVAFIVDELDNWKKGTERFDIHEKTKSRVDCLYII
ncbi:unnamed protein product [Didymodactylos carnosus]|uniref:Uncharacterized protein n=1 Tax=Didymodactylos carnosus TaxID=1234261 RepID=A0A814VLR1_9BILA|nr:unnamed protein product [Didymodactylos carnosus]CAF1190110.1 unnamed protein product [Didymodactylos carnosus]CAF3710031.1 unnamed protein product [Didymodactylos carnosus]CAF3954392.1 unnamed protein product [Didymodactylos carnosus]